MSDYEKFIRELSELSNKYRLLIDTNRFLNDTLIACIDDSQIIEYYLNKSDRLKWKYRETPE